MQNSIQNKPLRPEFHIINTFPEIIVLFLLGALSFGILAIGFIWMKKKSYERIICELKADCIECSSDFLGSAKSSIKYKDIKGVEFSQGILQQKWGIGTVTLATNATKDTSGFFISDIKEYQEVYEFILEKIKNNV
jgi:uncharacterized membrane protein YdbT with pleckstrin-like domain